MSFCPVNFLARQFGVAIFVMVAISAAAQPQAIPFTKPVDQDVSAKANAFMSSGSRNAAGSFNAPAPLFGNRSPAVSFEPLPGTPRPNPVSAADAAQWQKYLAGTKNWALMTPAEILGVRTPEEFLGLPDPKNDPKLSPEERFILQRRDRQAMGATNGLHSPDAAYWRGNSANDPSHPLDYSRRLAENPGGAYPGAIKNFNPLFNPNPDLPAGANQKPDSAWANPFGLPEPLPKQTPEQLAGMDRFRALMEPSVPDKTPEPARFSYQPGAGPDPSQATLPAFNPNGRSYTPLNGDIGRPTGVTPLPGVTGPHPVMGKKTSPLVQLPPWFSDSPQGSPAQRKF